MPKIVDHTARLHTILEQALDIFSRTGYYNASYEKIAEQCGLSRTGLYKYFANKDAIFTEVVGYVVDDVTKRLEQIMHCSARPSAGRAKEVLDVFVHFMKNRRFSSILLEFTVVMNHDDHITIPLRLQDSIRALWDVMETVFSRLSNSSSYTFSLAFIGLVFFQSHILQPLFSTVEEEGDRYVSLLRRWEELSQQRFDEQQGSPFALGIH